MSVVAWDHEVNELQSYEDFMASDYAKQCAVAYIADGKTLPDDFREFESYVLSGVSLKDVFYTKILPKSLQDEKTSSFLGYSQDELNRVADVRFQDSTQ